MDVLRTAVSALAGFETDTFDNSIAATRRQGHPAHRAGADDRRRACGDPQWQAIPAADPALSHAANFLWMITGRKPSADAAQLMDRDLILHAEHGSNASSFTARVVIGTEANLHAAMTSAIAALSGPAHGGAAEDVMRMAQEIGEPENAAAYVKAQARGG